ncbi:MAG: hypothetical protein AAFO74_10390 [Pseudomonadota bacterium]
MFYKSLLMAGAVFSVALSMPSAAQIESDGMGEISAWGQRYLSSNETEFPSSLWRNSDDETLLGLLQAVRASKLGPAERGLLRRVILSPATPPRGAMAEALLAERARLMLELGEARAAAALVPQLEQAAPGLDAETLAIDLDLASGQEASACGALNGPIRDGAYWAKLRAVCAVLRDNYSGAELAIEFAAAQGVQDDWMVEAIFAAAGDTPNPPGARFDTGLNIALSSKAALDTSRVTLAGDRPDLAAAAARRPNVPVELRARFAEMASERDLISPGERRDILLDRLADETYVPSTLIEQALASMIDPLRETAARESVLAAALQTSARYDLNRYRSTAQLFVPDLKAVLEAGPSNEFALDFAHAAMIAGDADLAMAWLETLTPEPESEPEPEPLLAEIDPLSAEIELGNLEGAMTEAVATAEAELVSLEADALSPEGKESAEDAEPEIEIAEDIPAEPIDLYPIALVEAVNVVANGGAARSDLEAIEQRLINSINSVAREHQAARVFSAWTGLGIPVSPFARDFIIQVSDQGERLAQGHLLGLKSAVRGGAVGETSLMVLTMTNGRAAQIASADLAELLEALQALDAEDVARALAVESTEFWDPAP